MSRQFVLPVGCLPATPFRDYAGAAAAAGFDAITTWPLCYRRATGREGLDAATMRSIVADLGLEICELDPVGVWLPDPPNVDELPTMFRSVWERHQFFEVAASLGVGSLTAVELAGWVPDLDVAVEGFAALCDDAAEHGLSIALEFMPFSGVPDLAAAMEILGGAARSNAGLLFDVCHFVRSGGELLDLDEAVTSQILSIQIGDGAELAPKDLRDEAMFGRLLPGEGAFDVAGVIAALDHANVVARMGPEVYQKGWSERDPNLVAADLMAATKSILPDRPR